MLVQNHYSLVSAGTEGGTVKTARKGYLGKAKERPQQVKQVLDVLRSQGPVQTWRAVMKKLEAFSPLGYSCAGQVIAVAPDVDGFHIGDLVACGGLTASHAEVVAVPKNLCVKLSPDADLKQAAYNTLGAIAMQGFRQADLRLGETCAVIGLGLIGQLTCLLLRAAGVRVVGIDIDPQMVRMAGQHCADLALERDSDGILGRIEEFTHRLGCDAVIITAGSSSLDPINFAGAIARKRAAIVVVGAVPTGFDREPHFYKKELTVRMSCSYGPGRYDPNYEEKGIDYPPGYVRWTEQRNMQAFQELIASGRINVSYLTTHVFDLEDAAKAYDLITSRSEPFAGILIRYDTAKTHNFRKLKITPRTSDLRRPTSVCLGFIGAGSYAQSHLLPSLGSEAIKKGVMTASGTGARSAAERFGFEFCTTDAGEIIGNPDINTVFIATRHDTHARYVIDALRAGKHVFVEKPLCLTPEELLEIVEIQRSEVRDPKSEVGDQRSANDLKSGDGGQRSEDGGQRTEAGGQRSEIRGQRPGENIKISSDVSGFRLPTTDCRLLMVGYNRRFAPLSRTLKEKLGGGPLAMIYRVNAGAIAADSWIQDKAVGGGRIIGEVCHFVDYLTFLCGALPVSVQAFALDDPHGLQDTLTVSLRFENGAVGSIVYLANGAKALSKERVEVHGQGVSAVLDDFRELTVYGAGKPWRTKLLAQDKGQKAEVEAFLKAAASKGPAPIAVEEIFAVSWATFAILESLRTRQVVEVQLQTD